MDLNDPHNPLRRGLPIPFRIPGVQHVMGPTGGGGPEAARPHPRPPSLATSPLPLEPPPLGPLARQLADTVPRPPRRPNPLTVAVMRTPDGALYGGGSNFRERSGSSRTVPLRVQQALDNVPEEVREDFHGHCAEIDAISQAVEEGKRVSGSHIATARVRGFNSAQHGTPHAPCPSCQHVIDELGVTYEEGP